MRSPYIREGTFVLMDFHVANRIPRAALGVRPPPYRSRARPLSANHGRPHGRRHPPRRRQQGRPEKRPADSQRERLVQRQQRQEQRVEEQKAKWKEFFATAKLTWPQQQELEKRLAEEEAARRAMVEQLQNGPPNPDAFRALRDQRKETDAAMSKLLDDTQKEQYQALRREDRGGRGGPGADQLR